MPWKRFPASFRNKLVKLFVLCSKSTWCCGNSVNNTSRRKGNNSSVNVYLGKHISLSRKKPLAIPRHFIVVVSCVNFTTLVVLLGKSDIDLSNIVRFKITIVFTREGNFCGIVVNISA